MFRTIARSVLTALPAAALSVCALAQTADSGHPSFYQLMLQKMDTNGDGRISLDEYVAAATARFKSIDTQNKGSVDAADIAASPVTLQRDEKIAEAIVKHVDKSGKGYISQDDVVAAAQARFARMDKNGDGKLTPDELTAPGHRAHAKFASADAADSNPQWQQKRAAFKQKYFDHIDTNHDGVITQGEYIAAATAHFNKIDTNGTGEVTAQQIAASPRMVKREQRFAAREVKHMDSNGDGTVSQDEYLAAAKARFAKLDKNGDGFIEADEMPAHHWAHAAKQSANGG
jgi:Ca2+-binding EF-hand superfamily protein